MSAPTITLNNGVEIPQLGFGVWQVEKADAVKAVRAALDAGYRHIDTAQMYGNEAEVGKAVVESGVPRDEIFVTTKLDNDGHGFEAAKTALDGSLSALGLDRVDLFLIHWPRPSADRFVETWKAFEQLVAAGKTRAIGVSNFTIDHLDRLAKECDVVPAINQIELHPRFPQPELRAYHHAHGIATEAWSPIGQGGDLLDDEKLVELGKKYDKSPAQIVLRWHIQLGNIVFPKSVTPSRIVENFDIFDFQLAADDIAAVDALDSGQRLGPDPADFG